MGKKVLFKKNIFLILRMMFTKERAMYLKRKNIFHHMGENCLWQPYTIPSEPYLLSLGDNVKVTAGVRFVTHDITPTVFDKAGYPVNKECLYYMDKIVVGNNVMIGADSILLPGITIGDNVIIAAGSVVSSNIPSGTVVGGCRLRLLENLRI